MNMIRVGHMKCGKSLIRGMVCDGDLIPQKFIENGTVKIDGLVCNYCGRKEITSEMTTDEYSKVLIDYHANKQEVQHGKENIQ